MKKSFFRLFDKIVVLLLGCAGILTSCDQYVDEYGMPHADFELKGAVTSKATAQPIQNIRVVRPYFPGLELGYTPGDTVYTDKDGKYAFAFGGWLEKYQLKFEDIDGEENGGLFQPIEIEGKFTQADQVEKVKGWYEGKFVKTENVTLEPVNTPEYGVLPTSYRP